MLVVYQEYTTFVALCNPARLILFAHALFHCDSRVHRAFISGHLRRCCCFWDFVRKERPIDILGIHFGSSFHRQ